MSGIVLELQRDAVDARVSIVDLIRKARIVSSKLGQNQIDRWLQNETNGYAGAVIPEYRKIQGVAQWRNPVLGWRPVLFSDEEDRKRLCTCPINQPISELAHMAYDSDKGDEFYFPAPTGLQSQVAQYFNDVLDVRIRLARSAVVRVVESVRDRILEWALQLERAGVVGADMSFGDVERKMAQNITINNSGTVGDVTNVIADQSNSRGAKVAVGLSAKSVAELMELLRDLTDNLASVGDDEIEAMVRTEVRDIEDELARAQPRRNVIRTAIDRILPAVNSVASLASTALQIIQLLGQTHPTG